MVERLMYFLHWVIFSLALGIIVFGVVIIHRGDAIGYGYLIFGVGGYIVFDIILCLYNKKWHTFPWSD
ncbi:MAG: hypothetical protein CMM30_09595 [Rhodospirillaceae bacterium]|nr:hypothetical protein [Rhodospirillaceae bacterium]